MSALLDKIQIEDLPPTLRPVAEAIGIAAVKALIVKCPGMRVYIPKTLSPSYNEKYIRENFTGDNYQEIADHLQITTRSVYRVLKS